MRFWIRATLTGGLIGASLDGGLALAAVDAVPNFNVDTSCQAAAQQAAAADYMTVCRNSERRRSRRSSVSESAPGGVTWKRTSAATPR